MNINKQGKERIAITAIVALLVLVAIIVGIYFSVRATNKDNGNNNKTTTKVSQTTTKPKKQPTSATILSTGDVLIHKLIFTNAKTSDGEYDFDYCFEYVKDAVSKADYAVANFEVTMAGEDLGYTFFPTFNSPDSIATALKTAGFDMMVTANNHSADKGAAGITRTAKVLSENGLDVTGTKQDASEKNNKVVEVNKIKIGIVNYTFAAISADGRVSLNGNAALPSAASACVNAFDYSKLDSFYSSMQENIKNMKTDGAEAIMLYIHWGDEYSLSPNANQKQIAQKMCDLGVDVIIGGHPHVIQPVEVLTSEVSKKMTVCLYSDGNLLSNQRIQYMGKASSTGHTEDGILFLTKFTKDTKGKVKLTGVDYIPTWINYYSKGGKIYHQILPLNDLSSPEALGLNNTNNGLQLAEKSKARTDALVGAGVKLYNDKMS